MSLLIFSVLTNARTLSLRRKGYVYNMYFMCRNSFHTRWRL